jgi:hypothetical protein
LNVISKDVLEEMVRRIHSFDELRGCPIGLQADNQSRMLNPGFCAGPNSARVVVIIEECVLADDTVLQETREWAGAPDGSLEQNAAPAIVTNKSRVGSELVGAAFSCTMTVVSAAGVLGGAAAEVPSAGTSTFVIVVAWAGLITQSTQCANGLIRATQVYINPEGNSLQQWDQNEIYKTSILLVDAIGIASGIASLPSAFRSFWAVAARQKAFLARGITFQSLKSMNRFERAAIIKEVLEEASRASTEERIALMAAAKKAGVGAGSMQATTLSVRNANAIVGMISEQTARGVSQALSGIRIGLGSSAASLLASGARSDRVGSASGSVNYIINLIDNTAVGTDA